MWVSLMSPSYEEIESYHFRVSEVAEMVASLQLQKWSCWHYANPSYSLITRLLRLIPPGYQEIRSCRTGRIFETFKSGPDGIKLSTNVG
ncbi:hypothetical protein AVEN_216577-1 [Araneus ventricosus]|uniref:Uncharacterized protein n=1 Tax=Araneus ventricosus TaxID=182803 RepID=A0A4Y2G250_ARAVE|nr:hypothetical protein AVEN_216577-1 [Araneus ventricosus]